MGTSGVAAKLRFRLGVWAPALSLVLLVLAAYLPALSAGFV